MPRTKVSAATASTTRVGVHHQWPRLCCPLGPPMLSLAARTSGSVREGGTTSGCAGIYRRTGAGWSRVGEAAGDLPGDRGGDLVGALVGDGDADPDDPVLGLGPVGVWLGVRLGVRLGVPVAVGLLDGVRVGVLVGCRVALGVGAGPVDGVVAG